jgi:hypothetical protein
MSNPNIDDLIPPEQPVVTARVLDALPSLIGALDRLLREVTGQKLPFVLLVFAEGGAMHATNIQPASQAVAAIKELAAQWDITEPQARPQPAGSAAEAQPVAELPDFPPQDYYASDKAFWDAASMRKFAYAYAVRIMAARKPSPPTSH